MRRVSATRVSRWSTLPSPTAKEILTVVTFTAAIASTLLLGVPVSHPESFISGIVLSALALVFALIIGRSQALWRFNGIVAAANFVAIFLLRYGTDAGLTPLLFLPVLPVLVMSDMKGGRHVIFAIAGSFLALVVPQLLEPEHTSAADLWVGIIGTLVLAHVAVLFNRVVNAQRDSFAELQQLAALRDQLLAESVRQVELLEASQVERRAVERTFDDLWAAVTEQSIIGTDLGGRIDAWNPGAEKLIGITADQARNREIASIHSTDELAQHARDLALVGEGAGFAALIGSAASGVASAREWTYLSATGTEIPVQLSVTPRFGAHGEPVGYLFVANDVTEAKQVSKLKDEFVGLISHELRTPLSSILGYLELLRDDGDDELSFSQLQYLSVAERNAHRLLKLVGDLLFTAQVESGSFHLDSKPTSLAPLVTSSVETAAPSAKTAGITMVTDVATDVVVTGDVIRLGQAIDNLVSNAIKFTPRGGTVTVKLAEVDGTAMISVQDTGMGIPAAEMDKLFSRFFRATTATKSAVPGVGLGLTITKAIIAAHHGHMDVQSEEGVGTCFSISLPLALQTAAIPRI